jgi:hypothetical protein
MFHMRTKWQIDIRYGRISLGAIARPLPYRNPGMWSRPFLENARHLDIWIEWPNVVLRRFFEKQCNAINRVCVALVKATTIQSFSINPYGDWPTNFGAAKAQSLFKNLSLLSNIKQVHFHGFDAKITESLQVHMSSETACNPAANILAALELYAGTTTLYRQLLAKAFEAKEAGNLPKLKHVKMDMIRLLTLNGDYELESAEMKWLSGFEG